MFLPISFIYVLYTLLPLSIKSTWNIHVIPHSHMDPGWLLTFNQYYDKIVSKIYSNILTQLTSPDSTSNSTSTPNRTFVACEIIFFQKWYTSLHPSNQSLIKQLVKEGRLEFVGGGLVMNDQASCYYQDIIDQTRVGMEFLKSEFNVVPTIGWALDPFGHSSAHSYLMTYLGFTHLVLERIDFREVAERIEEGNLEFIWKPFNNSNNKSAFAHVLPLHYGNSFYFNFLSQETKIPLNTSAMKLSNELLSKLGECKKGFKHNNYMFLLGDDFTFMNGDFLYKKMEFLMDYINNNNITFNDEKVNIFYSKPSAYFKAVEEEKVRERLKEEINIDFFPYADKEYAYWTGYFTSRPFFKGMVRHLSNFLLGSSHYFFENIYSKTSLPGSLIELQTALGLIQHHDAITGTSRDLVNKDYINIARNARDTVVNTLFDLLLNEGVKSNAEIRKICINSRIHNFGCDDIVYISDKKDDNEMNIGVLNPGVEGDILITIEIANAEVNYEVYLNEEEDSKIESDFYCVNSEKFEYQNKCVLNFFMQMDPIYYMTYFKLVKGNETIENLLKYPEEKTLLIENKGRIKKLYYDPVNETYELVIRNEEEYKFKIAYGNYKGCNGIDEPLFKPKIADRDGAYLFSPLNNIPNMYEVNINESFLFKGKISTVVITRYSNITFSIASFFYDPFFLKIDSILDPVKRIEGFNYILKIQSDINNMISVPNNMVPYIYNIKNNSSNSPTDNNIDILNNSSSIPSSSILPSKNISQPEFWTDSNGLEMMRRVSNYRHNTKYHKNETTASNFYPVPTSISIREKASKYFTSNKYSDLSRFDRMLTIFPDRPQSGTSLSSGSIELIISRASLSDDQRGIGSRLNETDSTLVYFKVSHFVMFGHSIYEFTNEGNSKSQMFIYNNFHRSPLLFSGIGKEKINERKSMIEKSFIKTKNVIQNVDIVSNERIVVQFYCRYDYYFENDKEEGEMVYIRIKHKDKVRMTIDVNGKKNVDFAKERNIKGKNKYNLDINMKKNDFVFVNLFFIN